MFKRIFIVLALMAGLLAGFYLAKRNIGVHTAVAAGAAEPLALAPNAEKSDGVMVEKSVPEAKAPQDESPTIAQVNEMLTSLNEKARQSYGNGWLHIREEQIFDTDLPNNGVLPNGEAIPLHQINDIWYWVEDGKVTTTLTIMHDANGHVIQVGICKKGVSWNSATKDKGSCAPTPLVLDAGFQHEMKWQVSHGATIQKAGKLLLPESNKSGYQVVLATSWSTPWHGDAYEKGITEAVEKAWFDLQRGCLVEWQTIFHFEDGSERVFRRITWEVSSAPPSPEAMKFLEILP